MQENKILFDFFHPWGWKSIKKRKQGLRFAITSKYGTVTNFIMWWVNVEIRSPKDLAIEIVAAFELAKEAIESSYKSSLTIAMKMAEILETKVDLDPNQKEIMDTIDVVYGV